MNQGKFEISGSFKEMTPSDAFLISHKVINISWEELVIAACKRPGDYVENKCVGFKVTESKIILLFEK